MNNSKVRDPETYAVIGACMQVHRTLGHGFLEPIYQDAVEIELLHQQIPHERHPQLKIQYRGVTIASHYEPDFLCFGSVIVELKALSALDSAHDAQVIHYLKATRHERGLLINFGAPQLEFKRLVLSADYADLRREEVKDNKG
jgi:GxxExxY protein